MKAYEHQAIGDLATGAALVDLGSSPDSPFVVRHGDVVALSGDYFLPAPGDPVPGEASLFDLAAVEGEQGARVGSRDEIVCALKVMAADEAADDARFGAGGEWADCEFGAPGVPNEVERRVRDRFITLAAANADHFVAPWGDRPARGGGRWRANQFGSVAEAYRLGCSGDDLRRAMAREAAAQHYLSDAFASGHLRTPVSAIRRYWLARYPSFWVSLQRKVAADTVDALRRRSRALRALPLQLVYRQTLAAVRLRTQAFPAMSLGDLLARVYHDWDNDQGLVLEDGSVLYGDGHVADGEGQRLAVAAVRAGNDDIEVAYRLGASGRALSVPALFEAVRQATGAPDGTFVAEGLVPRLSADNATLNWRAPSIEDLWHCPVVGTRGTTVGEAVGHVLEVGGEVSRRLDCLGPGVVDAFHAMPVPSCAAGSVAGRARRTTRGSSTAWRESRMTRSSRWSAETSSSARTPRSPTSSC